MAKYLVDNEEVWSEESAEDAIYSSIGDYRVEDVLSDFEEYEDIPNIEKWAKEPYYCIEQIPGFSIEEDVGPDDSASLTIYYNGTGIFSKHAEHFEDDDDEDDDDDYYEDDDDDNASFYRDCVDSKEDANEWYEGMIL